MLDAATAQHTLGLVSLVLSGQPDCTLVSSLTGGQVATHRLLLAMHSPLLARLLGEVGEGGVAITLPLPLTTMKDLVALLKGKAREMEQEVREAAVYLEVDMQKYKNFDSDPGELKTKKKVLSVKNVVTKTKTIKKESVLNTLSNVTFENNISHKSELPNTVMLPKPESSFPTPMLSKKRRGRPKTSKRIRYGSKLMSSCDICDLNFKTNHGIKIHKLKKHKIPINCDWCDDKFSKSSEHAKHIGEKHSPHICTICGDSKVNSNQLAYHMEASHGEGVSCQFCGQQYRSKLSCYIHVKSSHDQENMEECSKCGVKSTKWRIARHFLRVHTEKLKETCAFCGDVFKGIKRHMERTGCGGQSKKDVKQIPCDQCGKIFTRSDKMKAHVKKIHSGIRDKACAYCSYTTYTNYNLKLHISKSHLGTGLVKEACPYCQKETSSLEHHVKTYHCEQPKIENTVSNFK